MIEIYSTIERFTQNFYIFLLINPKIAVWFLFSLIVFVWGGWIYIIFRFLKHVKDSFNP